MVHEFPPAQEQVVNLEEPVPEVNYEEPVVNLEDSIMDYEVCSSLEIDNSVPLPEKSTYELALAIERIVEIEGPIRFEEVIKRIREYWGLKQAGKRIKDAINSAALEAEENNQIIIKDDFLYATNESPVKVRRRTKANIDLISPEEIEEAIKLVIQAQFATPPDDLITQTAHLFGFKSTGKKTAKRIQEVLNSLIKNGALVEMPNGMINFPK